MKTNTNVYRGYRFPPEVISHAVWLYHRFCLSFRDIEELLAERGVVWHLDEVFVNIQGKLHLLWRAVDQDGDLIDILIQRQRNARAAKRFFRKLLKGQGGKPWRIATDKRRSYSAAHSEVLPSVDHDTRQYANNRAEVSHQPTRQRERLMRRIKSAGQAQRFLAVFGVVQNLFRLGRHLLRGNHYRGLRDRSFREWSAATAT